MDFLFGSSFIFSYGLDLLVVLSLFLSAFSFFSFLYVYLFVCLYYLITLVCSSNKFTLFFVLSSIYVHFSLFVSLVLLIV